MIRSTVRGVGCALPRRSMKNSEFEAIVDTSDEWITQRTGIRERRIADLTRHPRRLVEAFELGGVGAKLARGRVREDDEVLGLGLVPGRRRRRGRAGEK